MNNSTFDKEIVTAPLRVRPVPDIAVRTLMLTAIAMLAFAANSILCRLALGGQLIDAASFTTIRLCSGAITLALIVVLRESSISSRAIDIPSALALFCYALCFSFAYIDLAAGTGALILFGSVQLTMIMYGLLNGDSPSRRAWLGIVVAFCGLVYLVSPGATAPSLNSATLMAVAGIAWGIYSLRGRRTDSPILSTAWNFIATAPLTLAASLLFIGSMEMTPAGVGFAILSGAVASSLGYIIWYTAIPYLTPTTAATVQLCVPVIAATGGVLFVTEPLSVRLTVSGVLILGGIALVIKTKGSLDK